jgi:hypothetical protein
MGKKKTYTVIAPFTKISSAIECVGITRNADIKSYVDHVGGEYHAVMGVVKSKKTAQDFLDDLEKQFNYSFEIIEKEL